MITSLPLAKKANMSCLKGAAKRNHKEVQLPEEMAEMMEVPKPIPKETSAAMLFQFQP